MSSLVVGCPILKRAWIVQQWYQAAVEAAGEADLTPVFVLVGDPAVDAETFEAYQQVSVHETLIEQVKEPLGVRGLSADWDLVRYERMVYLRNRLLGVIRKVQPDYFLSLDSDILIHPQALRSMVTHLNVRGWGAIGSRTYMDSTSRCYPSFGLLTRSGMRRPDSEGIFKVDVIMAIKLMKPSAYRVDYEYNWNGEDIGWCFAARRAGINLGWDGTYGSKHVMSPERLHVVDERVGF